MINRDLRRQAEETKRKIGASTADKPLWHGPFVQARNTKVFANFAETRSYVHGGKEIDRQIHFGYDLASTRQSPVPASNKGVVVFAEPLTIYGNAVVIDHGLGLQTLYAHLSSTTVKVGDAVEKGQEIARTGSTGLAMGDHLHYEVLVNGTSVTPLEWWDAKWIRDHIGKPLKEASLPEISGAEARDEPEEPAKSAAPGPRAAAASPLEAPRDIMDECCEVREIPREQRRTLQIVLLINAVMFLTESVAGVLAHSTALFADSSTCWATPSSTASVSTSSVAASPGRRAPRCSRDSSWRRSASVCLVQVAFKITRASRRRVEVMGVVGTLAFAANLWCLALLWRRRGDDINMRSAWICSRNDVIGNAAVLVAAGAVAVTGSPWPDIVIGLLVASVFGRSAVQVVRDASRAVAASG